MTNPTYAQLFQKGYKPKPRQPTEDPVLAAAKAIMAKEFMGLYYVIFPVPRPLNEALAPVNGWFYRIRDCHNGYGFHYIIKDNEWIKEPEITVCMRLEGRDGDQQLVVQQNRQWILFVEFLRELPLDTKNWPLESSIYRTMSHDWATNGKTFDFLRLPGEVRNQIYDCIATIVYPYSWDRNGWNVMPSFLKSDKEFNHDPYRIPSIGLLPREVAEGGNFYTKLRHVELPRGHGEYDTIQNAPRSPLSLLLVNKHISAEFGSRLWQSMEFCFREFKGCYWDSLDRASSNPRECTPLYRMIRTIPNPQALSHLCLHVKPMQAVKFFGVMGRHPNGAQFLFHLSLKSFKLHLCHKHPNWDHFGLFRNSCHKILTGLILMYAKTYISHIPTVTIQGCINPTVKEKYMQLLQDEKNGVQSQVTEWDIVGYADSFIANGFSWMRLTHFEHISCDRGSSIAPDHDCHRDWARCIDEGNFRFSENGFKMLPEHFP